VELVLHEHEVPVLEEALGVVSRAVVLGPELRAAVEVELGAGAAGAGRPRLPEVVGAAEPDDPLVGHADRAPALDRLLIGAEPQLLVAAEDADPDALRVEAEPVGGELERVVNRPILEVVADREVAEHLEEREVAGGEADVLDVGRTEALLAGGEAPRGRLLLAAEVGLERLHARGGEEHRGVVGRRHERSRRHAAMPSLLEEREKALPDLRRVHAVQSR
jgi:hypothetical protein